MSRIIEHMKAVMAAELKRLEEEYPLPASEDDASVDAPAGEQQPPSNAGKPHAR